MPAGLKANLGELLLDAAARFASRPSVGEMSYAQFVDAAQRVRATLASAGLAPNEPVHGRVPPWSRGAPPQGSRYTSVSRTSRSISPPTWESGSLAESWFRSIAAHP